MYTAIPVNQDVFAPHLLRHTPDFNLYANRASFLLDERMCAVSYNFRSINLRYTIALLIDSHAFNLDLSYQVIEAAERNLESNRTAPIIYRQNVR